MPETELHRPSGSGAERAALTDAAVLVADDDPAIRLVLRHRLEADGCRV
jgi:hypothetical protein